MLLFVVIVRTRLLGFPLERDEGEYAYLGQLILHGIPPFDIAYNMKFPGTYFMYALIMSLFGQTTTGVHLGLMVVNCITILLVYKFGVKMAGSLAGAIAACAYAALSLDSSVLGFAGHATHFVVFWAMAGLLVLLYALEKDRLLLYFAAGVLLCLAFIMKQPGIFFVVFGAAHIVIHGLGGGGRPVKKRMLSGLGVFLGGVLSTLSVMVVYFYAAGVFEKFWFFTFVYSFKYGTQVPLSMAAYSFMANFPGVLDGFSLIWVFAVLGVAALFLHPGLRGKRLSVSLFAACSFLTVCPGFYFRAHYFITLLPAVSLLAGIFIDYIGTQAAQALGSSPRARHALSGCVALAVFAPAVVIGAVHHSGYLFEEEPAVLCRKIYGINPFPESTEVARFIAAGTAKTDKIAVIGSEPQIYFYSGRRSATGYIYTYSLMEIHKYSMTMQKEMAAEIERSNPKFVVFVRVPTSWLARPESDTFIFQWADAYLRKQYDLAGIVDIFQDGTIYKWDGDVKGYAPRSPASLFVFRRR
ncbi:MAG: hypothetical protein A4E57_03995 [Syntrophorhabdaceae bacterium PtaU1.Bin034]|nr:MAG: hypothetical protein A4E57_03995 [Syntrophorhabdaceae bacterium PtaU1.Bin034]